MLVHLLVMCALSLVPHHYHLIFILTTSTHSYMMQGNCSVRPALVSQLYFSFQIAGIKVISCLLNTPLLIFLFWFLWYLTSYVVTSLVPVTKQKHLVHAVKMLVLQVASSCRNNIEADMQAWCNPATPQILSDRPNMSIWHNDLHTHTHNSSIMCVSLRKCTLTYRDK